MVEVSRREWEKPRAARLDDGAVGVSLCLILGGDELIGGEQQNERLTGTATSIM